MRTQVVHIRCNEGEEPGAECLRHDDNRLRWLAEFVGGDLGGEGDGGHYHCEGLPCNEEIAGSLVRRFFPGWERCLQYNGNSPRRTFVQGRCVAQPSNDGENNNINCCSNEVDRASPESVTVVPCEWHEKEG